MPYLQGLQSIPLGDALNIRTSERSSLKRPKYAGWRAAILKCPWIKELRADAQKCAVYKGFRGKRSERLYLREFQRVAPGALFRFMFFDALIPAYLGGSRAFYVF